MTEFKNVDNQQLAEFLMWYKKYVNPFLPSLIRISNLFFKVASLNDAAVCECRRRGQEQFPQLSIGTRVKFKPYLASDWEWGEVCNYSFREGRWYIVIHDKKQNIFYYIVPNSENLCVGDEVNETI